MEATATSSSDIHQRKEDINLLSSSKPKKCAGRTKFRETRHPVYHGVRRRRWNSDKWVYEIREPIEEAIQNLARNSSHSRNVAALALKGPNACSNFSDSVFRLPVPESSHPKDIRKAVQEGAEMFRPETELRFSLTESTNSTESVNLQSVSRDEDVSSYAKADAEEVAFDYDVTGLMSDLAEGVLMSPPHSHQLYGFQDHFLTGYDDDVDSGYAGELSLWDYSF